MFHRWMSTDQEGIDSCIGCGTEAPNHARGVVVDYSPLPLFCPEPGGTTYGAHRFTDHAEGVIQCERCSLKVNDDTWSDGMEWQCLTFETLNFYRPWCRYCGASEGPCVIADEQDWVYDSDDVGFPICPRCVDKAKRENGVR